MAESKIKINAEMLQKDTNSIESYLKKIRNKIKTMQASVAELDKMWDGEANNAFNKAFNDDITDLNIICDGIQSIIDYETNAKKHYDTCETKVSELIKSISV